jgi:hypothetical protein
VGNVWFGRNERNSVESSGMQWRSGDVRNKLTQIVTYRKEYPTYNKTKEGLLGTLRLA